MVKNLDSKWKYPLREDVQLVELDQIGECSVEGEWDTSPDCRKRMFSLFNAKTILSEFKNILHITCSHGGLSEIVRWQLIVMINFMI